MVVRLLKRIPRRYRPWLGMFVIGALWLGIGIMGFVTSYDASSGNNQKLSHAISPLVIALVRSISLVGAIVGGIAVVCGLLGLMLCDWWISFDRLMNLVAEKHYHNSNPGQ